MSLKYFYNQAIISPERGGLLMNLENWTKMINSTDADVVKRVCENAKFLSPYYYRKKKVDDDLINEIKAFNQFAIEQTGESVFDEDVPPLECGMAEVDKYFVDLGRARWYK